MNHKERTGRGSLLLRARICQKHANIPSRHQLALKESKTNNDIEILKIEISEQIIENAGENIL